MASREQWANVAFQKHLPEHSGKLLQNLHTQWKEHKLCDMKLVTSNGPLLMHACVWSAFSNEMVQMMNEDASPEFNVRYFVRLEVSIEVALAIVQCLYTGIFTPPSRLLSQIYTAASYLGLLDMLDVIQQYRRLNPHTEPEVTVSKPTQISENKDHEDPYASGSESHLFRKQTYSSVSDGKRHRVRLNRMHQDNEDVGSKLYKWSTLFDIETFPVSKPPPKQCKTASATTDCDDHIKKEIKEELDFDEEPQVFICNFPPAKTIKNTDSWSKHRVRINRLQFFSDTFSEDMNSSSKPKKNQHQSVDNRSNVLDPLTSNDQIETAGPMTLTKSNTPKKSKPLFKSAETTVQREHNPATTFSGKLEGNNKRKDDSEDEMDISFAEFYESDTNKNTGMQFPGEFADIACLLPVEGDNDREDANLQENNQHSKGKINSKFSTQVPRAQSELTIQTKAKLSQILHTRLTESQRSRLQCEPSMSTGSSTLDTKIHNTKQSKSSLDRVVTSPNNVRSKKKESKGKSIKRKNITNNGQYIGLSAGDADVECLPTTSRSKDEQQSDGISCNLKLEILEKPEASTSSRPKRRRVVSSRLSGCELYGDSQVSSENGGNHQTSLPTAVLNPDSSSDGWSDHSKQLDNDAYERDTETRVPDFEVNLKRGELFPPAMEKLQNEEVSTKEMSSGSTSARNISNDITNLLSYHGLLDPDKNTDLKCKECGATFTRKCGLSLHMKATHNSCIISLTCSYCSYVAKNQLSLRQHSILLHGDAKPFKCLLKGCTFSAKRTSNVIDHLFVHTNVRNFICEKCKQRFKSQKCLDCHLETCGNEKKVACEVCGKHFNSKLAMRSHKYNIHDNVKKYICMFCGKKVNNFSNFRRHLLVHNNEFPYPCKHCSAKFRHSNTLKAHMTAKH